MDRLIQDIELINQTIKAIRTQKLTDEELARIEELVDNLIIESVDEW